jgi:hypothetical protein
VANRSSRAGLASGAVTAVIEFPAW